MTGLTKLIDHDEFNAKLRVHVLTAFSEWYKERRGTSLYGYPEKMPEEDWYDMFAVFLLRQKWDRSGNG